MGFTIQDKTILNYPCLKCGESTPVDIDSDDKNEMVCEWCNK